MSEQDILNNVDYLSAEQLFGYIRKGVVTREKLIETQKLDASKRKKLTDLQIQLDSKDDEAWKTYRLTEIGCSTYIVEYPRGRHVEEAKEKIELFEEERHKGQRVKQDALEKLRRNPNSFSPRMIQDHLKNGIISIDDLHNSNVPQGVIDRLNNINSPRLELGKTPDSIPDGYTEVYFWGIPGSGKTCALAAILNRAENLGYLDIAKAPAYDYMTRLKNIFNKKYAILPPASPVETTQYLPFVLKKGRDKPRSVSLIELSGEIFQCFYNKNASKPLQSQQHEDTFNSLIRFLKGKNRKIHFFFIDFEKENEEDASGYTQGDYLAAASTYFRDNDIFGKSTDAIYLVITKSDLMPNTRTYEQRVEYAKNHLKTHNFSAFVNALKARCIQHSINAGILTVEPFSLGEVYFQQICEFDNTSATKIIDILIDRIPPKDKSVLDIFNK
jgi:hypothetical protein